MSTPPRGPRPTISNSAAQPRRPRWFLGTFWMFWAVVLLLAGIFGPGKWLILLALALGAYAVYLYRGGRFGFFFL